MCGFGSKYYSIFLNGFGQFYNSNDLFDCHAKMYYVAMLFGVRKHTNKQRNKQNYILTKCGRI